MYLKFCLVGLSLFVFGYVIYLATFLREDRLNAVAFTRMLRLEERLARLGANYTFKNGVPRVIHYNYQDRMLPVQYIPLVVTCMQLNPNVTFVLWTDSMSMALIESYYPSFLLTYRSYVRPEAFPLKKSDVIRYFILDKFGGIYMDLDTKCQRPIEEVMRGNSCFLSREAEPVSQILWNLEYCAMNSLMVCLPHHAFFGYILRYIGSDDGSNILSKTGPHFLTQRFHIYTSSLKAADLSDPLKNISIAPSDVFSPWIDSAIKNFCVKPTKKWAVIGCKNLSKWLSAMNNTVSKAVVVHLFSHLGTWPWRKQIHYLVDILTIEGSIIVV